MSDLPEEFVARMKRILGDEWELFQETAQDERKYGLRVNILKISVQDFERITTFPLTRISWIPNGFYVSREDEPASHPFYAAGLYYLQEPSAMTPASRLKVEPGDRVLDLCAAPGGKATELAAGLSGEGLLVANDINRARARALLRNIELFGVKNSMITNEPPHVLSARFPEYFDKIMVDAPCSGEGMFRKNPAVMDSWKEKGPAYFSVLQKDIIIHAADMLKPGGQMFYSTCTFAPEENEGVITHLLDKRPQMEIIPMDDYEGFRPGMDSFDGQDFHEDCRLCRRIWPHRMEGEGHFMALLRKKVSFEELEHHAQDKRKQDESLVKKGRTDSSGQSDKRKKRPGKGKDTPTDLSYLYSFLESVHLPDMKNHLDVRGDKAYLVPDRTLTDSRLHFLRNGLYLGELKKNRFEPSEPFALALAKDDYDYTVDFSADDERLLKYLKGESIPVDDQLVGNLYGATGEVSAGKKSGSQTKNNGWVLVMVEGYPISWGKLTGTVIKNKYPAAWRRNA